MSAHDVHYAPAGKRFLTPGVVVLIGLMGIAAAISLWRFVFGLSSVTNLNDQYPWGIWIGVDVASGVALAAGGFTTAALAHIFHRKHYEAILRPALLTAMLGYTFVGLALMVDLGRYYNIWHPAWPTMWQGNSVLFEVGMCVMAYLTVLYLEFLPIVCERFIGRVNLPGPFARFNEPADRLLRFADRKVAKIMFLLVIAGVVLSCMHQSSLGTLMVIAPYKMHALWYTPIMPLLFLLSAISVGYPMVVVESMLASRSYGRKPEMEILAPLSRFVVFFLGIYTVAKFTDLLVRGAQSHLLENSLESNMFLLEMGLGALLPLAMLLSKRVRHSPALLFTACALVVCGVMLNRVNVFVVAYNPPYSTGRYVPSIYEILVTIGMIAALAFVYRVAVTIFPVLPAEESATSHGAR